MGYSKITLHGGQTSDYLYIQKDSNDIEGLRFVDAEPQEWSDNTLLCSKFDNNLVAGNSSMLTRITGYEVRRRKGANSYTEYVCTVKDTGNDEKANFIIDYLVGNKESYTYYLYPGLSALNDNKDLILDPNVSDEVKASWSGWTLLIVDDSVDPDVFYLNKMFKFDLNVSVGDMNNNASISVVQNFTPYPTVQYGASNYWSGDLTSLCGYASCVNNEYIETKYIKDELKALTSDTHRKFLKDPDGSVYEVKITSPITISRKDGLSDEVKSVKIGWTEVGSAKGKSVINNPSNPVAQWVLTESGVASPYIDYTWDSNARWDNSLRWTEGDDNPSDTNLINLL